MITSDKSCQKKKVYILSEVFRTSSAEVTEGALRSIHRKVATLCSHPSLRMKPNEIRPLSWQKFLGVLQEDPAIDLQAARQQWVAIKNEVGRADNISAEDLTGLEKLKAFLEKVWRRLKITQQQHMRLLMKVQWLKRNRGIA